MTFDDHCNQVLKALSRVRVVPVLALDSVEDGLRMAEILDRCGLYAAEVTFRTYAAADVIRSVSEKFPQLCVGAGTVLNREDLQRAITSGAAFAVAPGFNPEVVREAVSRNFPFFPGVSSPTDIEQAMALGCRMLKFFPAEAAGGVAMLKALIGPYQHLGIHFMPTGGIHVDNMHSYLSIPQVVAVGGTWVGKPEVIAQGNWKSVEKVVMETVAKV